MHPRAQQHTLQRQTTKANSQLLELLQDIQHRVARLEEWTIQHDKENTFSAQNDQVQNRENEQENATIKKTVVFTEQTTNKEKPNARRVVKTPFKEIKTQTQTTQRVNIIQTRRESTSIIPRLAVGQPQKPTANEEKKVYEPCADDTLNIFSANHDPEKAAANYAAPSSSESEQEEEYEETEAGSESVQPTYIEESSEDEQVEPDEGYIDTRRKPIATFIANETPLRYSSNDEHETVYTGMSHSRRSPQHRTPKAPLTSIIKSAKKQTPHAQWIQPTNEEPTYNPSTKKLHFASHIHTFSPSKESSTAQQHTPDRLKSMVYNEDSDDTPGMSPNVTERLGLSMDKRGRLTPARAQIRRTPAKARLIAQTPGPKTYYSPSSSDGSIECSPNVTLRLGVQHAEHSPASSSEVDESNITDIIQRHLQPLTHYGQPTNVVMYDSPDDEEEKSMQDPDFTGMITTSPSIQRQYNIDKKPIELKPLTHSVKRLNLNDGIAPYSPCQPKETGAESSDDLSDESDSPGDERAEDMTMSLAPRFNLSLFPASFQTGENAEQIVKMYDAFKQASQSNTPVLTIRQIRELTPNENDTLLMMTDLLLRKKLIRRTIVGDEVGWLLRQ